MNMRTKLWPWIALGTLAALMSCESRPFLQPAGLSVAGRNTRLTGRAAARAEQVRMIDERIRQEVAVKNYEAAESDWKELIRIDPKALIYYQGLGNVYFAAGDLERARKAYRVSFFDPGAHGDILFETRFGELSYRSGHYADALAAYRSVVAGGDHGLGIGPAPDELHTGPALRATSLALAAYFFSHDPLLYLAYSDLACKIDPRTYYPHLVRADAYYRMGRIADARDERDLALRLAPAGRRAKLLKSTDDWYSFHSWDHRSVGTILPGGKLVVRRIPQRPPNNRPYDLGPTKKFPSYDQLIP